jgi:choice-of-anchor C domain-containing protein
MIRDPGLRCRTLLFALGLAAWLTASGALFAQKSPELPATVDLTADQSPFCNQGARDTCIYHPQIAALEAAYRRAGNPVRLSVEHLVWLRNVTAVGGDKAGDPDLNENLLANLGGGGMLHGFHLLTRYGVCRAEDMAYRPDYEDLHTKPFHGFDVGDFRWWEPFRQLSLNRFNLDPHQLPPAARRHARYGVKEYTTLSERDRRNPRKVEEVLAAGHEVALNLFVTFKPGAEKGRGDLPPVVWYRAKHAVPVGNSHAVLLVGYDRPRQFFIAKNSWGANQGGYDPDQLPEGWKDLARYKGFTLLHYNYLEGCREAGYIKEVIGPAGDPFPRQRALGLWAVAFRRAGAEPSVATAVLAWRRLPGTDAAIKNDLRIGDFYQGGQQYRVNARLEGDDPMAATLFIDFDKPQTGVADTRGVQLHGKLMLPEDQPGILLCGKVVTPPAVKELFGVPVGELTWSATQCLDSNPLLKVPTPNLLVNGSFEEGPEVDDFVPVDKGSTALKGWTVTRGQIDYVQSHWRADHGRRSLDLHGSPGYGGVAQTFATAKGQKYRVTFALAGSPAAKPLVKKVAVTAAGKKAEFAFDAANSRPDALGWSTKSWEFEATGPETTLEIYTLETTEPFAGPALDNVRVVPVPPRK